MNNLKLELETIECAIKFVESLDPEFDIYIKINNNHYNFENIKRDDSGFDLFGKYIMSNDHIISAHHSRLSILNNLIRLSRDHGYEIIFKSYWNGIEIPHLTKECQDYLEELE